MAEYIERKALIKDIEKRRLIFKNDISVAEALSVQGKTIREAIEEMPAEDVVKVVRCKDCKMSRETEYENCLFCMQFADTVDSQAFCSYGERREK